jgi:hypothetical protein
MGWRGHKQARAAARNGPDDTGRVVKEFVEIAILFKKIR